MSAASLKELLSDDTPDLRKVTRLLPKIMKHPRLQKLFFKVMTKIWSEDEESRRILAFVNILKAVNNTPECISLCIKTMFMAYVRNCKFVFGGTVAHINFLRLSLLELFSKNLDEAYMHAFAYIRQLAICLRKANSSHSKDDLRAIQNWQYISSLQLWSDFVARHAASHKLIRSLVHPVVQLIVGTTKLSPGERWLPLRFHCVRMLHVLAGVPSLRHKTAEEMDTDTLPLTGNALAPANRLLVSSLPILLDTFRFVNFNRRAKSASAAPLDLRLLLHFSPSQRRETSSLDAVVSWLFDLLTEASAIHANSLAFPEFALPLINELKQFVRTCRVASFARQMKALQSKLREHSDWIATRRRRLRNLSNPEELINLETALSVLDGSNATAPFWSFYVCHKEVRGQELARLAESYKKELIPDEPAPKKRPSEPESSDGDSAEESESTDSDESYEMDDGTTVTHVSKSNQAESKTLKIDREANGPVEGEEDSEDSDFDLEAALKEPEEKSDSDAADEVTDFELSASEDEDEVDVLAEDTDEGSSSPAPAPSSKRKQFKSKFKNTGAKKRHLKQKPQPKGFKRTKLSRSNTHPVSVQKKR